MTVQSSDRDLTFKAFKKLTDWLNEINHCDFPHHWFNITQTIASKICVNLLTSGPEFTHVSQSFMRDMPGAKIVKVEMIQNYFLWQSYNLGVK